MALPFYSSCKKTISSTPSDYWKESLQALIDEQFENASNVYTIQKKNNTTDLYEKIIVRLEVPYEIKQASTVVDDFRKIIFKDDSVSILIGDYYIFNNSYWICIDDNRIETPTNSCIIQRCTTTLSYYNNHILYSVPAVVASEIKLYSIKEETNKFLSYSADENMIICPNNSDSIGIDENTRFILTGEAYKVVGINKISNPGLLVIKVKKELVTEDDNLTLNIANYYSNQLTKEIYILNGTYTSLFYAESTLQLNVQCKEDGEIVTSPTVIYSSANETIATVSTTGLITLHGTGDVVITATYGTATDTITIHGDIADVNNYNINITPFDDTLKLSRSIVLTGQVMNKGVVDVTRHVNWSIINLDGTSDVYATITPNVDTCTVLAGNSSTIANKYIVVRASLIGDATVFYEKQIKIINLF